MRVGILGVAHVHADQLIQISKTKPVFDIVGIWDRDSERAKKMSDEYGVKSFNTMDDLLDEKLDGVFIFSENVFHKDICLVASKKVKNIMCEKPLATNVNDAIEMVRACKVNNTNLMLAFNNRFTTPANQAYEYFRSGKAGKVIGLSGTNHGNNPGGWFVDASLSGGGSMIDHTVHLVDLAYWITGLKPISVYATKSTVFNDIDVEDCGSMIVELEGNIPLSIDFSWSRMKSMPINGDNKLQINGTEGTCLIDNRGERLEKFVDDEYTIPSYAKNAYDEMLEDFVRASEGKEFIGCTGEEGIIPVQVVQAAYESCKKGEVVSISNLHP